MASRSMSRNYAQLYSDLAQASGGQAIEVSKSDLSFATRVILDSSATAVVSNQTRKCHLMKMLLNCINPLLLSGDSFSGSEESRTA